MKAGATHKPGPHGLGVPIRSTQSPRRVDWDEYEFGNRVSGGNGGQEVGGWRVVRSADVRVQASTNDGLGWRLCSSCKRVSERVRTSK